MAGMQITQEQLSAVTRAIGGDARRHPFDNSTKEKNNDFFHTTFNAGAGRDPVARRGI
jgi:5-carboxymethyl-2-hydroxymuconate isomerase